MKRHGKNFLALFGSDAIVRLLGFAAAAVMARVIDTSAFGVINFGMAVLSYGVLFSSPGVHIIGALKIAEGSMPAHRLVGMISWIRIILAAAFSLAAAAAYLLHPSSALAASAFFFSWTLIPLALQLEWYFQGRETLTVVAAGKIIGTGIFAAGIFFLLTPANYVLLAPIAYGVGVALQSIFLYIIYRSTISSFAPSPRAAEASPSPGTSEARNEDARLTWSSLIRQSLPVGAAVIAAQALLNFPSLALGFFSTAEDIAHFSAAAKLVFFALAIDRVMYSIFFPFVARMNARDPGALPVHLDRIARYIFIICLPVCVGGSILAPQLLALVYGAPYAAAAPLLRIQLWYFFFTILNSLFSYPLIALGEERFYGTMTTAITVGAIALMLPLTYYFGAFGASAGMVIAEIVLVAVMARRARSFFLPLSSLHLLKPLAASAAMGCFLVIFSYISLFVVIPAGALVYAAAAYAVKAFDAGDVHFVKEQFV